MEGDFLAKPESAFQCSLCYISSIFAPNFLKFEYVVAETLSFVAGDLRFLIRCWDHAEIFNLKGKFSSGLEGASGRKLFQQLAWKQL